MSDLEANKDSPNRIQRLKNNDAETWCVLWGEYQQHLHKTITYQLYRYNLPVQLVDDVLQETWCIAIKRLHTFNDEDEAYFLQWLRTIAHNCVCNMSRKRCADYSLEFIDNLYTDSNKPYARSNGHELEEQIILREDIEALRKALSDFQPREREIIIRRYLWQQKPIELAKHFPSLKPRSISQLLLRARKRLHVLTDQ